MALPIPATTCFSLALALKLLLTSRSETVETRNEAATSKSPATSGPMMLAMEKLAWTYPFAAIRSSGSTRLGRAAKLAAVKPMVSVALTNETTYIHQTDNRPRKARRGMEAITNARAQSVKTRTRLRLVRSTQAPIANPKRRYGRTVKTNVNARLSGEVVSFKTSKGNAKPVTELPSVETVCPLQNFQKSPFKCQRGA